ncbi:MAG: glycosyltransferase, partial [Deinococcales bacterium]|nr:glycosyltransferase [Chitinophagaceae bacterium]
MPKKISIVIPVCNEKGNIPTMIAAIQQVMLSLKYKYNIIYVDDGSDDDTLDRIKVFAKQFDNIFFISFSRNFGHQNALKAGFDFSDGD